MQFMTRRSQHINNRIKLVNLKVEMSRIARNVKIYLWNSYSDITELTSALIADFVHILFL